MAFRKAKAQQAFLKYGIYGPYGSGKTFTSLLIAEGLAQLMSKRVAYVDTEHGTDFYAQKIEERAIHPEEFDFDRVDTKSLTQALEEVRGIDPGIHGVVVIDSITHLWEAAIEGYGGAQTSAGTIPFHAWGTIKKPYKEMIALLLNGSYHVIIAGRQKNIFGEDETGDTKLQGVTMKAEGETPYEPHILIRMIREVSRKTSELAPVSAFFEKDRTGILAGSTITLSPTQKDGETFDQLAKPFLAVLGTDQAKVETTEEAGRRDAEDAVVKKAETVRASKELKETYLARIRLAKSREELESVTKELTAEMKKGMVKADVGVLRQSNKERWHQLSGSAS